MVEANNCNQNLMPFGEEKEVAYFESSTEITKEMFKDICEEKLPNHVLFGEIKTGRIENSGYFYAKSFCKLK